MEVSAYTDMYKSGKAFSNGMASQELPEGLALVTSRQYDALPITSFRVESEPCLEPNQVSSRNGTQTLPNEVMQA